MTRKSTKRPLAIAASAAVALALAGCGGGGGGEATDNGDGESREGGTLVYAITADPGILNPVVTTTSPAQRVGCLTYEGLTQVTPDLETQPLLAESWDISEDGRMYTFHLRKGVKWHDGEPFTSADVVWSLENASKELGVQSSGPLKRYDAKFEAIDESTVTITLNAPYSALLTLLDCQSNSGILPKHLYENTDILDNPHNTGDVVGTGPFVIEEWTPGSQVTLVKNEDYWQDNGEPYLDKVVMPIITDAQAAIQALQAGEIDAVGNETASAVNVPQIVDASGGALYQYQDGFVPQIDSLQFNTTSGVLADPKVRQAIATAIDVQSIIDLAYFGLGSASKSAIASPTYADPAVDYTKDYAYDPEKAEQMLRDAGVAEGTRLRLIYGPYRAGSEAAVQVIRENLAGVGIEVELMPMEHAVLADTVYVKNDYDMFYFMFSQRAHPAVGVSVRYTCGSITHTPFTNGSLICDESLDAAFAQGESGATEEEQKAGYAKVQEILNRLLPVYNIRDAYLPGIAATKVHGLDEWPDSFRLDKVWIEG